jgi:chromosome segregation ATPase
MKVKDLNYQKYLKYKNKYLDLQNKIEGGGIFDPSKKKIRLDQIKLELEKLYNEGDLEKLEAERMLELIKKSGIHDQLKMENENDISKRKQLERDVDQLSLDIDKYSIDSDQYNKDIDNYNVELDSIDAKPYNIETNIELNKKKEKILKEQKELKKRELQILEKQKEIKERSDKLLKNMKKITESIEKNGKKLTELTERGEQIKKLKERKKELERERDLLIKTNTLSNRLSKIFKH